MQSVKLPLKQGVCTLEVQNSVYEKSSIQNWGWRGEIVLLSTIHRGFWEHALQQKLLTFLHSKTEEYSKFTEGLGLQLFFLFPPLP